MKRSEAQYQPTNLFLIYWKELIVSVNKTYRWWSSSSQIEVNVKAGSAAVGDFFSRTSDPPLLTLRGDISG